MLTAADVTVAFGGFQALKGVALEAAPGSIVGLVGPNGSGKSTLLNVIAGTQLPDRGEVRLDGQALPLGRPDRVAARGIGRTFQVPRLARRLTVLQNLLVGSRDQPGEDLGQLLLRPGRVRRQERANLEAARAILARLGLEP